MPSIIVGLLAVSFGIWGLTVWWWSVVELLRGLVPVLLMSIGILALASGVSKVRLEKGLKDEDMFDDEFDENPLAEDSPAEDMSEDKE